MGFLRFSKNTETPFITIYRHKTISFNSIARQIFNLNSYKFVELYFDIELNKIGFKFYKENKNMNNDFKSYSYQGSKKNMLIISCSSFLRYFNVNHEKTARYNFYYDSESELYMSDLNNPLKYTKEYSK